MPLLIKDCALSTLHPRLEFLAHYDLRLPSEASCKSVLQSWSKEGIVRPKTAMSILMFLSLKGSVAKTTNAVAVAECLADSGNRVLVIDTDHQCGAGALLMGEEALLNREANCKTLADLFQAMLTDDFDVKEINKFVVKKTSNINGGLPNLSVIPCSLRIEDFWSNLAKAKREIRSVEGWMRLSFHRAADEGAKMAAGEL